MKKNRLVLLTAILALAGLSGCGKNNQNKQLENDLAVTGVTLNVTYASVEAGESITLEPTIHFKDDNPVECYTEFVLNPFVGWVVSIRLISLLNCENRNIEFLFSVCRCLFLSAGENHAESKHEHY